MYLENRRLKYDGSGGLVRGPSCKVSPTYQHEEEQTPNGAWENNPERIGSFSEGLACPP